MSTKSSCLEVHPGTSQIFDIRLFVGKGPAELQEYINVSEGPKFQEPTFGVWGRFYLNCVASTNT